MDSVLDGIYNRRIFRDHPGRRGPEKVRVYSGACFNQLAVPLYAVPDGCRDH